MGDHLEHAFLPGQQGLAPLQGRLGLLAILDVGRRARPVHEVSQLVAHRHRTEEAPAVRAIETSEAYFRLSRRSRGEEACPGLPQRPEVVGMNRSLPPPIEGLRQGEARIVEPALVEQGGGAIRPTRPRQRGDAVEHHPQVLSRCVHGVAGLLPRLPCLVLLCPTHDCASQSAVGSTLCAAVLTTSIRCPPMAW